MTRRRSTGFTLVELLVVIAIIGMLMALLLPAIGYVRRLARRTTCLNNVRELTKGVIMFETTKKRYPGHHETRIVPGPLQSGNPTPSQVLLHYSWIAKILPYIDEQPTYDNFTYEHLGGKLIYGPSAPYWPVNGVSSEDGVPQAINLLRCGEDTTLEGEVLGAGWINSPPWTSYVANAGYLGGGNLKANGVFHDYNPTNNFGPPLRAARVTFTDLRDGAGSTLLLSENLQAGYWHSARKYNLEGTPQPLWDKQVRTRLDNTFVWGGVQLKINGGNDIRILDSQGNLQRRITIRDFEYPCTPISARPSSGHGGLVVVSFADGRTQLLNDDINFNVYYSLMTPDNTKSSMPDTDFLLKSEDYNN